MDITSFLWGLLGGVALGLGGAFVSGFGGSVGGDAWRALKGRIWPEAPDPVLVDARFEPELSPGQRSAWVVEAQRFECEQRGWRYYLHPGNGARVRRRLTTGEQTYDEFLMIRDGDD